MRLVAAFLIASLALPALADDDKGKGKDKPKTPDEKLAALVEDANKAVEEFIAKVRKAKPEERQKMFREEHPTPKFADKFLEFAKENGKSDAAAGALCWIAENMGGGKQFDEAIDILGRDHLGNPKIGVLCSALGNRASASSEAMLVKILKDNPAKDVKGLAAYGLASLYKQRAEFAPRAKNPEMAEQLANMLGKEVAESLKAGPAASEAKAIEYYELVASKFADVDGPEGKLGELAKPELFELKNLSVGKVAPEIVLKDLEGNEAKLSALKGKVVVLDVWATWCGPCRAMIPHEREMVKKFEGKPFEFVSISFDDSKETLQNFLKKEPMPWTHWFNGPDGPMGKAWNIRYFPTIYVLDSKGVIRFKGVRGEEMTEAVQSLLDEMKKGT